jgi:dsDNA-binding SOS-regulon protein
MVSRCLVATFPIDTESRRLVETVEVGSRLVNVLEDMTGWIAETTADVTERGAAKQISLMHLNGRGEEVEILSIQSNTPQWGKPADMAERLHAVAQRHARGIPGQQQFMLACLFATDTKPTRFLPFGMPGALQFGAFPGGGLSTEGPSPTGMVQQDMRLKEVIVQGAFAKDKHATDTLVALLKHTQAALETAQGEVRDLWVALREVLVRLMEAERKAQLDIIAAKRNAVITQELIRLGPAMINGVTGRNIFPIAAASASALRGLNRILDATPGVREQLAALALQAGPDGQAAYVALNEQLEELARQDREQEKKVQELAGETVGDDYSEAMRDASGLVLKTLRESARHEKPNGVKQKGASAAEAVRRVTSIGEEEPPTNPVTLGERTEPAPAPLPEAVTADATAEVNADAVYADFGESFFASAADHEIEMLAGMVAARGHADLAKKMRDGYALWKGRAAARAVDIGAPAKSKPTEDK